MTEWPPRDPVPQPDIDVADPFDLPDWLGWSAVVWTAEGAVTGRATVPGRLVAASDEQHTIALDLMAVDAAVPAPVCDEKHRALVHRAWRDGESVLLDVAGRPTVAVPGHSFDANLVVEALRRFSRAVGARAEEYAVQLRL